MTIKPYCFIIFLSLLLNCTSNFNSGQLHGRWHATVKDVATDQFANSRYYFEFHEDGHFSTQVEMHESTKGTWRMSEDSIFLEFDENLLEGTVEQHSTDSATHIILHVVQKNEGDRRLEVELRR